MYADSANKLILEAKRGVNLAGVPLYNAELVKNIIRETADLNRDAEILSERQQLEKDIENDNEEAEKVKQCRLFVTHLCMRRNKRCLLAYERSRAEKIDEFTWLNVDPIVEARIESANMTSSVDSGAASTANDTSAYVSDKVMCLDNLNYPEQDYFKQYQQILTEYKSHFADIDLSGPLEPPKDIFIDVRVLKDGGEVQTEYGVFNLIKNSQFYVRKSDVERLIQQGYLAEI